MDRKPLLRTIFLMTRKRLQKKFPGIWRNLTVAHLLKRYRGDSPLFNAYVGALPPGRYRAHVCYLSGRPDGNNNMENVAEVTYLNFTERQIRGFNIPIFLKFLTYLREKEIDVVHCHRHSMTVLGALATLFNRRVSVISHVHGLGRTRSMKRVLVNRFLFSRVVRIIAVSESVRHDILATNRTLAPGKVTAVRNGIDLRPIDEAEIGKEQSREKLGIPGKGIVFGTVGRLVKTKGQVYLIEAFAAIRRELDDARLIIIGDGPLRDELREKAENLDILQFTTFTGFRPDALALLRALDIFVFPSLAEGLGLALLEAMASRLPVVATNAGGIPEVFGDSRFGRIVPVGDSRALAAAMKELALLGSDERKRMGDLARKRVEDAFTAETMQREMRAVYESILPIVR
jgi:glycosyltransferase involved in cell wall biosynthesis